MPDMDQHAAARAWLTRRYEDPDELVGLSWPTLHAMTRLVTSRRIMGRAALRLAHAWATAQSFLDQHDARLIQGGSTHRSIASELFAIPGLSSDDVPDVQLAALAIEHGLTLCSHDHGFARFGRLAWTDPLHARSSGTGRRAPWSYRGAVAWAATAAAAAATSSGSPR